MRARRVQAFPAAWPHDPEGGAAADGPARPGRPAQVDEPQASVELDSEHQALQAQLAEAYQSALEEKDRELAEMRAPPSTGAGLPARGTDEPGGEGGAAVTDIFYKRVGR